MIQFIVRRSGTALLRSMANACGIQLDSTDEKLKFYDKTNSAIRKVVTEDQTQTLTNKTITGATISGTIAGDAKTLAADATADSGTTGVTLTSLTGLNFDLVAGATYQFEIEGKVGMTTNGGLTMAFKYTTLTLTSIVMNAYQFTAAAVALASSTTTTDQTKFIDQKTTAYVNVRMTGSLVVNAAGNLAIQFAQNTSHADTTTVFKGFKARFTRTA